MSAQPRKGWPWRGGLALFLGLAGVIVPVRGQSLGGAGSRDSSVGYIDSAVPVSQVRLRGDAAYRSNRPSRAEFFYPQGGPAGRGLPLPETAVDYQELTPSIEVAWGSRWSTFLESPLRFLNPDINANSRGVSDLNAGFKYAFWFTDATTATIQFRTYAPTGEGRRGLGTEHVSLEPSLLVLQRLSERLILEGELRYWVPIGGTDFAGDLIRYGIGLSYGRHCPDGWWLSPVVEVVGWTVLGGKEQATPQRAVSAAGDTIVNAKLGVRLGLGERVDGYIGYGRALTGDTWYKDTLRVEVRVRF